MVHHLIRNTEIVLGSASERRKTLLRQIGVDPVVITVQVEELMEGDTPRNLAEMNAGKKNDAVRKKYHGEGLIVTADTIVVHEKHILGKPRTAAEAEKFLKMLSGRWHEVMTGITLFNARTGIRLTETEISRVRFSVLEEKEIQEYIQTGEPFDKAGAYGIQGYASQFIEEISGDYFNVVGFPIALFYRMLKGCLNV